MQLDQLLNELWIKKKKQYWSQWVSTSIVCYTRYVAYTTASGTSVCKSFPIDSTPWPCNADYKVGIHRTLDKMELGVVNKDQFYVT